MQLRLWNEVATLLLFAIVFLIVLKSALGMAYGLIGLIGLGIILMIATKIYKKYRIKS
jgi:putative membrane protein